jgi:molybdenum cofactor guanylyltransferase
MEREGAEIAMAAAREEDGQFRAQPVFSLIRHELMESLVRFTQAGGRKIDAWTGQHRTVLVPFDRKDDDPSAFFNANTLAELHRLEQSP